MTARSFAMTEWETVQSNAMVNGSAVDPLADVEHVLEETRRAQQAWANKPIPQRLECIRSLRDLVARDARQLLRCFSSELQRTPADSVVAEILPLAEAARFLELNTARLLRTREVSGRGRPWGLGNVRVELRREALGVVLIIGPSNYPLFLPGVQALQALAAGNAVLLKPGRRGGRVAAALRELAVQAGVPPNVFVVLDERAETAIHVLRAGVNKVVMTGSVPSGRSVLEEAAQKITPAVVELSGCDSVFVRQDGNVARSVQAIAFGLRFNGGATCIAPRRIFVFQEIADRFQAALTNVVEALPPVPLQPRAAALAHELINEALAAGAIISRYPSSLASNLFQPVVLFHARPAMRIMRTDLFAPVASVMVVKDDEEAIAAARQCPYALGATIFGEENSARRLASRVPAGVVVVNDMIVPTADPRLPFGGMQQSGFGKTRGAEGLLEMTHLKVVAIQQAKRLRHLEPSHPGEELFVSFLAAAHRRKLLDRLQAWWALANVIRRSQKAHGAE